MTGSSLPSSYTHTYTHPTASSVDECVSFLVLRPHHPPPRDDSCPLSPSCFPRHPNTHGEQDGQDIVAFTAMPGAGMGGGLNKPSPPCPWLGTPRVHYDPGCPEVPLCCAPDMELRTHQQMTIHSACQEEPTHWHPGVWGGQGLRAQPYPGSHFLQKNLKTRPGSYHTGQIWERIGPALNMPVF